MDHRKFPTTPAAPETVGRGSADDVRPRYEPPRIVKRRSVVHATGQYQTSSVGLAAGGLPAGANG